MCKRNFKVWPSKLKEGKGKYCSRGCANKSMIKREYRNCLVCNKEFYNKPSQFKAKPNCYKYCSIKCSAIGRSKRVTRFCLVCSNKFEAKLRNVKKGHGKYCSKKCWYSTDKLKEVCSRNGKLRKGKTPWINGRKHTEETRGKMSEASLGKPWTEKQRVAIMPKLLRGENHPYWKGGITPLNSKIRHSATYKDWAKEVKRIWDYECQICGEKGGRLHSNHIKKFSDYSSLRLKLSNGIALCRNCHTTLVNSHEKEWESYFNFCWENKLFKGVNHG